MGTQVVVLVGNLGKDAELRLLPNSGKPILDFDLPIDDFLLFSDVLVKLYECLLFFKRGNGYLNFL